MNKKGLSMISMLVYVVLFFAFSAFAVGIATNMNYRTLSQKGNMINNEQLQKLQYNLLNSAKESQFIEQIGNRIVFSNNDEYYYDEANKRVMKNEGIIATDVTAFRVVTVEEMKNVPENFVNNLDKNKDNIGIEVTFTKYKHELKEIIFVTVGDE